MPENTNKAMKFGRKVFQGSKRQAAFDFVSVLAHALGNHIYSRQPRETQLPSRSLSGIGRKEYRRVHRQKCQVLSNEKFRVVVQENSQFLPRSCVQIIIPS